MKNDKLDFYMEVEIINSPYSSEYIGKKGTILGVSEDEDTVYGYLVALNDSEESAYVDKKDVIPTGKKFSRSDFYDGSHLIVSSEGKVIHDSTTTD